MGQGTSREPRPPRFPKTATPDPSRKLRVVSYNVAGNHADYSEREDAIVMTLLSADADVICLQEVWGENGDATRAHSILEKMRAVDPELADAQVVFFPLPSGYAAAGAYGNAIFSRLEVERSAWAALGTGSMLQDDGARMAGQMENRVAVYAKLRLGRGRPGTSHLHVVTVHVGIFNSRDQEEGAGQRVVGAIEGLLQSEVYGKTEGGVDCCAPVLLCGDFNAGPASKIMELFKDSNWDFGEGFHGTHVSRYLNMTRPLPLREEKCTRKIDYILRRDAGHKYSGARIARALPHCIVSSPASDHYPVVTTFQLSPPAHQ